MKTRYSVLQRASRFLTSAMLIASCAAAYGQASPAVNGPSESRVEVSTGYSYFRPFFSDIHNYQYQPVPIGGIASVTAYFNRYLGVQAEGSVAPNASDDNACVYTAQAGPVIRYQKGRFVPFFHVLGGAAQVGGPVNQPCNVWGWGITGGLGLDYILPVWNNHLAIRPIQADFTYSQIDNGPLVYPAGFQGGLGQIYAIRYSAAMVFRFGNMHSGEGATMTCSATPAEAYPGEPITLEASALNVGSAKDLQYLWTSTTGPLPGTGPNQAIDTANVAPGSYAAAAQLVEGKKARQVANCTADFKVLDTEPPVISCAANRNAINSGDPVVIAANAHSPQNLALTYSYTTTNGQIVGTGSSATLTTTGATPGAITITCNTVDSKGKTSSATTSVVVASPPPPPPAAEARSLCGVSFERDRKRPTRVDNEAKGCLDDIALTMNRESGAKLQIVGNRAPSEPAAAAATRARNVGEYLVKEKGIDPSRLDLRQGNEPSRTVTTTLIPPGAGR